MRGARVAVFIEAIGIALIAVAGGLTTIAAHAVDPALAQLVAGLWCALIGYVLIAIANTPPREEPKS